MVTWKSLFQNISTTVKIILKNRCFLIHFSSSDFVQIIIRLALLIRFLYFDFWCSPKQLNSIYSSSQVLKQFFIQVCFKILFGLIHLRLSHRLMISCVNLLIMVLKNTVLAKWCREKTYFIKNIFYSMHFKMYF